MRVPQAMQDWEPGSLMRHVLKFCSQMKLGTVPWYWAMFAGPELLAQVQVKERDD